MKNVFPESAAVRLFVGAATEPTLLNVSVGVLNPERVALPNAKSLFKFSIRASTLARPTHLLIIMFSYLVLYITFKPKHKLMQA